MELPEPPELRAFLASIALRDFARCRELLERLRERAESNPALRPWVRFYDALMLNEERQDCAAAEQILRDLAAIDGGPKWLARILLALGVTLEYQNKWRDARQVHEQSLTIFRSLGQIEDQAKGLKAIAITYNEGFARGFEGEAVLQRALELCNEALDLLEQQQLAGVTWLKGAIYNTLGLIYRNMREFDQAIASYERDMELAKELNNEELNNEEPNDEKLEHTLAVTRLNIGEIYQLKGPEWWPEARKTYLSVLRVFQRREEDGGDRLLTIDALENLASLYKDAGSLKTSLGYYRRALASIERLSKQVSAESARAGYREGTANTYAHAALLCLEMGDFAAAFNIVERGRGRSFLDALAAQLLDLTGFPQRPTLSLKAVQQRLPAGAVLLAYFTTGLTELHEQASSAAKLPRFRFPPEQVWIFYVTATAIEAKKLAEFKLSQLRPRGSQRLIERYYLREDRLRWLYDSLVAPVAEGIKGRTVVYLLAHGPLHLIPFQAVFDQASGMAGGGPVLVYSPSATVLFRQRGHSRRAANTCLALGYNGGPGGRLRFAEDEARIVASLFGGSAITGAAPKKARLLQDGPEYVVLHIACHAEFNAEQPLRSMLHLGEGETLCAAELIEPSVRLRCRLVVLSACETGLNHIRSGEELYGFVRALMLAGAPAVVCSMWRVDDQSTRLFMDHFYQELLAGSSFAEALRRTQRFLRELTRREAELLLSQLGAAQQESEREVAGIPGAPGSPDEHPYASPLYWAPFVLVGGDGWL